MGRKGLHENDAGDARNIIIPRVTLFPFATHINLRVVFVYARDRPPVDRLRADSEKVGKIGSSREEGSALFPIQSEQRSTAG